MSIFEVRSRVTHRSLMNKSKADLASLVLECMDRSALWERRLRQLACQPHCPEDHMTACDRIMGATHPCTCGADEARRLLGE